MPSPRGEVFHFIFHFHYLSGESINARRIREITWALASPGLVLILLSAHLSLSLSLSLRPFFILLSLTLLSLFTHHLFPLRCPFLCLYQSLHVIAALSPSSPRSPVTYPCFYFSPPLSSFFSRATASPLFLFFSYECFTLTMLLALPKRLTLDQHDWVRGPHGSCWLASSSVERSVLRRAPPPPPNP